MNLLGVFRKQRDERPRDERPEKKTQPTELEAPEPLSDEERKALIAETRSDLPELDRKFEENLERLRELSRS